jgi:hypothetical protein
MMPVMNPPESGTSTSRPRRLRPVVRIVALILIVASGYFGWCIHKFRADVREVRLAGLGFDSETPIDRIEFDWRNAFKVDTWTRWSRELHIDSDAQLALAARHPAVYRLKPTRICIRRVTLTNLRPLASFASARSLEIYDCHRLSTLAGIESFTSLETLSLDTCFWLRDVEAAKSLSGLKKIVVGPIDGPLPPILTSLKAALPGTTFIFQ